MSESLLWAHFTTLLGCQIWNYAHSQSLTFLLYKPTPPCEPSGPRGPTDPPGGPIAPASPAYPGNPVCPDAPVLPLIPKNPVAPVAPSCVSWRTCRTWHITANNRYIDCLEHKGSISKVKILQETTLEILQGLTAVNYTHTHTIWI